VLGVKYRDSYICLLECYRALGNLVASTDTASGLGFAFCTYDGYEMTLSVPKHMQLRTISILYLEDSVTFC
jgi:hypothetical protein